MNKFLPCIAALAWLAVCSAYAELGDVVTTALPPVTPGEFNGDLSKIPPAPASAKRVRERPYRARLLSGALPKLDPAGAESAEGEKLTASRDGPKVAMPAATQNFDGINRTDACVGCTVPR